MDSNLRMTDTPLGGSPGDDNGRAAGSRRGIAARRLQIRQDDSNGPNDQEDGRRYGERTHNRMARLASEILGGQASGY